MGWTDRIARMGEEQCVKTIVKYEKWAKFENILNVVMNC
jgi:hypothetical protein